MGNENFNSKILDISPVGIITFNEQGEALYANPEAEKILGVSGNEIGALLSGTAEATLTDFEGDPLPSEQFPLAQVAQALVPVYNLTFAIVWPSGRKIYLSMNAAPLAGKGLTVAIQEVPDRVLVEQRHQDIFDYLMDEVHVWKVIRDEAGGILTWELADANASSLKSWGQTLDAVVGKTATEIFGQEAHDIFKPIVEKIFATGNAYRWETYFSPTQQYLSMDSIPIGDVFISTGRDVTEIMQYQQELTDAKEVSEAAREKVQRSELRLKNIHSMAKLGGWEFDVATGIFSFNDNFYEIFRASVDRIGGYEMTAEEYTMRFVHPEDRAVVGHEIGKALETKDPKYSANLEHRMLYEDGAVGYITVKYFIIKDAAGNTTKLYGVNQDITDSKEIEKELIRAKEQAEANEERYGGLLKNMETGVVVHAADTSIIICNPRSWELLGLTEAQMKGKMALDPYWKFVYEDRSPMALEDYPVMQVLNSQSVLKNQILGVCRSGEAVVWLLVNGIPVKNSQGEIKEIIISFLDITDRKMAEEELRAAKEQAEQSDRLKTAFLQNLSHEIRTPLNAICGFAQLLDKQGVSAETRHDYISLIQSSSEQLLGIITDVLTISSLETGQEEVNIKRTNINGLLQELLSIFEQKAQSKRLHLRCTERLPEHVAEIETDETKLRQVLSNLLANALKFTNAGRIEYGCRLEADKLTFFVKDTGIGVKPEHQQGIFERFKQADESIAVRYGGTGLGLSISAAYVALLGGTMWLDSEPGKGSTFYFTIAHKPIDQQATHTPEKETAAPPEDNFTLLVAEDQLLNFKFLEGLLRDVSANLIHARDGQEAVDLFQSHPEINLILMDVKMPNMTGDEAAKIIKAIRPDIPIIAQSGYALVQEKEKYAGVFDEYVTKPIHGEALVSQILRHIDHQKASRAK